MGCANSIEKAPDDATPCLAKTQNPSHAIYTHPKGSELLVSARHASCSKLPPPWNSTHDRFIAYLATHAPLDRNGRVPYQEERRERWSNRDIAQLVMDRFPEIGRYYHIKVKMIENRLALLDRLDNEYFKMPYGAYAMEGWGRGI
ncbi:hypothetical protein V8E51_006728 [Hyaloscypha variabilis]